MPTWLLPLLLPLLLSLGWGHTKSQCLDCSAANRCTYPRTQVACQRCRRFVALLLLRQVNEFDRLKRDGQRNRRLDVFRQRIVETQNQPVVCVGALDGADGDAGRRNLNEAPGRRQPPPMLSGDCRAEWRFIGLCLL